MLKEVESSIYERMGMLGKAKWGSNLTDEQMEELAKYLYVTKVAKGGPIFNEGSKEAYMCFVVTGSVKIAKEDSQKKEKIIAEVGSGKTFGEMSIIDKWPRSASSVAADDTTMLVLTKDKFDLILQENPKLGNRLLMGLAQMMSSRLRLTDWMLVEYLYQDNK